MSSRCDASQLQQQLKFCKYTLPERRTRRNNSRFVSARAPGSRRLETRLSFPCTEWHLVARGTNYRAKKKGMRSKIAPCLPRHEHVSGTRSPFARILLLAVLADGARNSEQSSCISQETGERKQVYLSKTDLILRAFV